MTLIQDDKLNKYINKIKFSRLLALDTCTGTTFYGKGFGQKILFTSCQKQRNLLNKSCQFILNKNTPDWFITSKMLHVPSTTNSI